MGFFLFIVVGGIAFYMWMKKGKENQACWQDAATRLGLGYFPGDVGMLGKISGLKGGHLVEINSYFKTQGNASNPYTKYRIRYHEPIQVDFRIVRQNALHKTASFLGLQDVEVGDPAFDDRALVRGMYPDRIIEFLTLERRMAIVHLLESYVDIEITNEYMELNKPGKDTNAYVIFNTASSMLSATNDLTDTTPTLADTAHIVEINESPFPASVLGVEKPEEVEPTEKVKDPYFPENPFVKEPSGVDFVEDWGADGSETEPGSSVEQRDEVLKPLQPVEPTDPEITVTDDILPDIQEEAADEQVVESGLQVIADELFSGDSGAILKAAGLFKERYENKRVVGEGLLKRVSQFSYDPVFTSCGGVKATFKICDLPGPYSKIQVMADVMYPKERYTELKAAVGSSIPISGTLVALDAVMHQLFVRSE